MEFNLESPYKPAGDQPQAIEALSAGAKKGGMQTLMGITGSGKTFAMASVIAKSGKNAIIISHNKTLAAQLYAEFQQFFPKNNVGYFISYYDYYQPESYIAQSDTYIEKSAERNEKLEEFRMQATSYLLSGQPTVLIASVSCIYGLGNPSHYKELGMSFNIGETIPRKKLLSSLVEMQYNRNDAVLDKGKFRMRGDILEILPPFMDTPIRVTFDEGEVEKIESFDLMSGKKTKLGSYFLLPAKHFVVPKDEIAEAVNSIEAELEETLPTLAPLEKQRLEQRTRYDLEMIGELGFCNGIENYSRHFDGRREGERPYCLLDYFPEGDFLMFIDESHITIPQIRGMYFGDHSRKRSLVENGFRLPSAFDNRPLKFNEFEKFMKNVIFVSATPSDYEREHSSKIVEQIVRPTGLVDPEVEVRKTEGQVEDLMREIKMRADKNEKVLVTTLTKRMAEDLASYLHNKGVRVRYLHSEIETIERTKLIRQMRMGKFDCLVGINLLREGLDIPEVSLVAILDADKTGFLRSQTSLIQTIGRAARNVNGKVIMYADSPSEAMKSAIAETIRRREKQLAYNKEHGIIPKTISKPIPKEEEGEEEIEFSLSGKKMGKKEKENLVLLLQEEMMAAAERLDFERAISLRDKIRELGKKKN
ncbi:excinuclease ABC subunit UvrB [Candidatus Micrarchaeota archaeon]|nr:excinuclease ABC subunit UvrB [Candidatus Micrarchaeota archaeon]